MPQPRTRAAPARSPYSAAINAPYANAFTSTSLTTKAIPGTRSIEQKLIQQRTVAETQQNLSKYYDAQAKMTTAAENEDTVVAKRRLRVIQKQNEELRFAYELDAKEEENAMKTLVAAQNEALAQAMSENERKILSEKLKIEKICNESEEIRMLKEKIRLTEINAENHQQILSKQSKHYSELEENTKFSEEMNKRLVAQQKIDEELELMRLEGERKMKILLGTQMQEKMRQRAAEEQKFLQEKKEIDAIIERLEKDNQAKFERTKEIRAEKAREIQFFLEQREQFKENERKRREAEEKSIADYSKMKEQQYLEKQREENTKKEETEKIYLKIKTELLLQQEKQESLKQILDEHFEEERERKYMEEIKRKEEQLLFLRNEMKNFYEQHKQEKIISQNLKNEEERLYREQLAKEFEENERFLQQSKEKQRIARSNYGKEIDKMIQLKKEKYEAEIKYEKQQQEKRQEEIKEVMNIIENEKNHLIAQLKEKHLEMYYAKGIFSTKPQNDLVPSI